MVKLQAIAFACPCRNAVATFVLRASPSRFGASGGHSRMGGALFREGAGGLDHRLLRQRSRRLRGRRGGRGLGGAGLHGAHPRLTEEGIPLLLCAVEGVLIDVASDAWDPAFGLILPEMPGARAVLHGRM